MAFQSIVKWKLTTSVAAQRIICDHAASVGYKNIELTKSLLLSASSAHHRYMAHLDDKQKAKKNVTMQQKRNALMAELDQMKCKKRCLEEDIRALTESADTYAEKAETSRSFTMITKSNSMCRSASENSVELKKVQQNIEDKLTEIKNF